MKGVKPFLTSQVNSIVRVISIYKIMATKLIFEDDSYEMEVFINHTNKITFKTQHKEENDLSVLCLDNNDTEKLIKLLQYLLKCNS